MVSNGHLFWCSTDDHIWYTYTWNNGKSSWIHRAWPRSRSFCVLPERMLLAGHFMISNSAENVEKEGRNVRIALFLHSWHCYSSWLFVKHGYKKAICSNRYSRLTDLSSTYTTSKSTDAPSNCLSFLETQPAAGEARSAHYQIYLDRDWFISLDISRDIRRRNSKGPLVKMSTRKLEGLSRYQSSLGRNGFSHVTRQEKIKMRHGKLFDDAHWL